jgi:hypothetical protein
VVRDVPSWRVGFSVATKGVVSLRTIEAIFRIVEPHAPVVWGVGLPYEVPSSALVLASTLARATEALSLHGARLWRGTKWGVIVEDAERVFEWS